MPTKEPVPDASGRPLTDRYAALRAAQDRSNTQNAKKRAQLVSRGINVPVDDQPTFDPDPVEVPAGHVRVRVLQRGDGKISTGLVLSMPHEGELFPTFKKGDHFVLAEDAAYTYETSDRFGWIERVDA